MHPLRDSNSRSRLVGVRLWMLCEAVPPQGLFSLRLGQSAGECASQGLEFALTLGRGAALDVHWTSIHYRTRSSPWGKR